MEALEEADVAAVGHPGLRAVEKSGEKNGPLDTNVLLFRLLLFHTRMYSLPNSKELLAFASVLSISLSILASDEVVQPR